MLKFICIYFYSTSEIKTIMAFLLIARAVSSKVYFYLTFSSSTQVKLSLQNHLLSSFLLLLFQINFVKRILKLVGCINL